MADDDSNRGAVDRGIVDAFGKILDALVKLPDVEEQLRALAAAAIMLGHYNAALAAIAKARVFAKRKVGKP